MNFIPLEMAEYRDPCKRCYKPADKTECGGADCIAEIEDALLDVPPDEDECDRLEWDIEAGRFQR